MLSLCISMSIYPIAWFMAMLISNRIIMAPPITLLLLLVFVSLVQAQTNGTEAYFLSPQGLSRTSEVSDALDKISGQIRVKRTTYNHSSITYILDNVTIGTSYNSAKQTAQIPKNDQVKIMGGRVEFTYRFNYTKIENRNNITGFGYGSVLSDPLTYNKEFGLCGGFVCWKLLKGQGVENLTLVENRMKIKRLEPFNQGDLENLEDMLDKVFSSIDPANLEVQILQIFNQIFPLALEDSLNHEVFGENINYSFQSNTHGQMKMNVLHQNYGFGINPEDGYKIIFVTQIQNWNEPICPNESVRTKPYFYQIYGGSQIFHLNCLYLSVVQYLQSNGWLDTLLNSEWQSDAFQFYAGDLFDLINNLHLTFSPRASLDGACSAQKDGLRFWSSRDMDTNAYTLNVKYNCSLKGTNKEGSVAQILKFRASTNIIIKADATTKTLTFQIIHAEAQNLSFEPVGSYFVSNIDLAMYKANSAMKSLINMYTFGTGFPTLPREFPKTRVEEKQVLYSDVSQLSAGMRSQ